jgi:hypothetical protein
LARAQDHPPDKARAADRGLVMAKDYPPDRARAADSDREAESYPTQDSGQEEVSSPRAGNGLVVTRGSAAGSALPPSSALLRRSAPPAPLVV